MKYIEIEEDGIIYIYIEKKTIYRQLGMIDTLEMDIFFPSSYFLSFPIPTLASF